MERKLTVFKQFPDLDLEITDQLFIVDAMNMSGYELLPISHHILIEAVVPAEVMQVRRIAVLGCKVMLKNGQAIIQRVSVTIDDFCVWQ
jgi:hypothetical protein